LFFKIPRQRRGFSFASVVRDIRIAAGFFIVCKGRHTTKNWGIAAGFFIGCCGRHTTKSGGNTDRNGSRNYFATFGKSEQTYSSNFRKTFKRKRIKISPVYG
jgi:hypothetical protein